LLHQREKFLLRQNLKTKILTSNCAKTKELENDKREYNFLLRSILNANQNLNAKTKSTTSTLTIAAKIPSAKIFHS
jgi:hypothetical protein